MKGTNIAPNVNAGLNPCFKTKTGNLPTGEISQRTILNEIAKSVVYMPNPTQLKSQKELQYDEDELALAFKTIKKENRSRRKQEFQFKMISGIIYANSAYCRMGFKNSAKCTFCEEEYQNFIHLYIHCQEVEKFRKKISSKWEGEEMTKKRWILGISNSNEVKERSKNYIAKESNYFIFKMNWADNPLSIVAFLNMIFAEFEPEEALAQKLNKENEFQEKWDNIKSLLKQDTMTA